MTLRTMVANLAVASSGERPIRAKGGPGGVGGGSGKAERVWFLRTESEENIFRAHKSIRRSPLHLTLWEKLK